MYDIGIDLGTSAVKLLLLDTAASGAGSIRTVSRSYPVEYPQPGWSQQNAEDWWTAILDGMRELLAGIDTALVRSIAAAGQMHGLVALDADGSCIRPVILWNDGRTAEETEWLNREIGREKLLACTGNIAFAGFTAPKLLWMKRHEPENFAKIAMILLPKDYITWKLTGSFVSDYSDAAGTLLLDVQHKCWSREMLEICGLREGQLPELHESFDIVGTLTPACSAALGLPETVQVAAGAGDNAAAAVGTGCLSEGQCNLSLGTSGTIFLPTEQFRMDTLHATHAFCHAAGNYHLMGCMLSAASCLKWWAEEVCGTADLNQLLAEIPEERLGKNHVFFLPYLMGERAPHNDPYARGTFVGMTADSTRADMTQAVLEGVAFAFRDMMEAARALGVEVSRCTLCGGGAKSRLWKRILANCIRTDLVEPENEQGPGMGAALLGAYGSGGYASLEAAAAENVRFSGEVLMEPALVQAYEARYQVFRTIYPAMKQIFRTLG